MKHRSSNSLETTWTKLENSFSQITPRVAPNRKKRPSTGKTVRSRHLSQDLQIYIPEPRRSRINFATTSFIRPSTTHSTNSKSLSFSFEQFTSGLTTEQIRTIYEAKCRDLDIQPFPEQEKRFFSYCFRHFYCRNFDLSESGLGIESAKVIASILQNSTSFSYIRLGKNILGDKGCVELIKGVYKNPSFTHLDLSSNELTCDGVQEMVEYFNRNESLISINLSSHKGLHRNRFGAKGAEGIGKILYGSKILSVLNISGTSIGDEGLECLFKGIENCKSLLELNISCNGIGWEKIDGLGVAISKSGLTKLDISNNKLGNDGADGICQMLMGHDMNSCALEILDVSENEISTKGASRIFYALTNNNMLRSLDLSMNMFGSGLSDNFAMFLIENSGLKKLSLSKCEIKSAALGSLPEALPKNRTLEELDLSKNKICDNGAEAICQGLCRNLGLKKLNLSTNYIKERGGKAFANCFRMNHSLEELNLKENNINDIAGQSLDDICRKNHNLQNINLELNSVALSFVYNIKQNLKKNQREKSKKIVPELRLKIDHLSQNSEALTKVKQSLMSRENEYNELSKRIERNNERYKNIVAEEKVKNDVVKKDYEETKGKSNELNKELESIVEEFTV